ncbi:MAG: hypothetical protein JWQ43_2516 [Glaciihabitans sp.]|nr:hypothetical protein [Glaciihabitans sp.]
MGAYEGGNTARTKIFLIGSRNTNYTWQVVSV